MKHFGIHALMIGFFSTSVGAQATDFQFLGVAGQSIYSRTYRGGPASLGAVTAEMLEHARMKGQIGDFSASERGVQMIESLGGELEVLSDTQMNAYGWCYTVDGRSSDRMPDELILNGTEKSVVWFYAYAHLEGNDWTSMCVPADHRPITE